MPKSTHKTVQDIYEDAQRLSEDQRDLLIAMLNSDNSAGWASPEIEQAWMEEVESREQLFREGKNKNLAWEEAREHVLKHLDGVQK